MTERKTSTFIPRFRLVLAGILLVLAFVTPALTLTEIRFVAMFAYGYLFCTMLHNADMLLDHRLLDKSWDTFKAHAEKLERLERQLMSASKGEIS